MAGKSVKKGSGGLTIERARIGSSGKSWKSRFFVCFFMTLIGGLGAFGSFYSGFSFSFFMRYVIVSVIIAAFLFSGLFTAKRYRLFCIVGIVIVLCITGIMLRETLRAGGLYIINGIVQVYTEESGFDVVPFKNLSMSTEQIIRSAAVISSYSMVVLTFLLVLLLTARRKYYFLCVALTVPFFAASLPVGIVPDYKWILLLFLFWALLVCDGAAVKGNVLVILAVVLLLLLLGLRAAFPEKDYKRLDFVENLRIRLENGADFTAVLRGGGVGGTTSRVDLKEAGNLEFSGKTMLEVRTARKDREYLKGFVGSVYRNNSWEPLPDEKYDQLEEVLGDKKVQNFPYWFAKELDCEEDNALYIYDMTVRNVGANARNIYIPYGLVNMPEELSGMVFAEDMGLRSASRLFGTTKYRLQGMAIPSIYTYMSLPMRILQWQENYGWTEEETLGRWDMFPWAQEKWSAPQTLLSHMTAEQADLVQTVEAYRDFVYENYTQVPEELEDFLNKYRERLQLDFDNYGYPTVLAQEVVRYIQMYCTYTLTPGGTPEGRDFVEYFLSENQQGYCRHFASAATLILRSAGVPARYVEGYTVSPNGRKNENGWIEVPDSSGHAWVEIYVSGMGWLPLETTGGVREDLNDEPVEETEPERETETAEKSTEETRTEEQKETMVQNAEASDKDNGSETGLFYGKSGKRLKLFLETAAGVILLTVIVLLMNRRIRIQKRRKKFSRKNRNQALLAMYSYMIEIRVLLEKAEAKEEQERQHQEKSMEKLALKAKFSQHPISEEELAEAFSIAEDFRRRAENGLTGVRRLWGKYLRGLI